jgi:hypothetical protein
MVGLCKVALVVIELDASDPNVAPWWNTDLSREVISCILKQSVERIDRMRTSAGQVLLELLYARRADGTWLLNIPGRETLHQVLPQ